MHGRLACPTPTSLREYGCRNRRSRNNNDRSMGLRARPPRARCDGGRRIKLCFSDKASIRAPIPQILPSSACYSGSIRWVSASLRLWLIKCMCRRADRGNFFRPGTIRNTDTDRFSSSAAQTFHNLRAVLLVLMLLLHQGNRWTEYRDSFNILQ